MKRFNVTLQINNDSIKGVIRYLSNLMYMTTQRNHSIITSSLVTCCLLIMCIACQNDLDVQETPNSITNKLIIDAAIHNSLNVQTKDLLEGTSFPNNSQIGVTVVDESGLTYEGRKYRNILYTLNEGNWTGLNVLLTSKDANVYAYYPYCDTIYDISSILIDADASIDYMYAKTQKTVNAVDNMITLNMSHAMAAISLKIVKGVYDKTGIITGLKWNSLSAAKTAKLDARTGDISNLQGAGDYFDTNLSQTNSTELNGTNEYGFLVVPTGFTDRLNFEITIDDRKYRITSPSVKLLAGNRYNYTLTINYSELSVSSVKVTGWIIEAGGEYIPEII